MLVMLGRSQFEKNIKDFFVKLHTSDGG